MASFSSRLTGDGSRRMRFYFHVQGVPHVWQTSDVSLSSDLLSSTYTRHKTILDLALGEDSLDLERRRMVGGSLTAKVLDDDGTLAALFAPRARRRTWITANASASATTISVDDTEKITTASAGTLYAGGETVTFTGKTGTTAFTGCTRGAFGSTARAIKGGAVDGDAVFDVPPAWSGRRVYLYAYDEDNSNTLKESLGGVRRLVGTFRLEEAPAFVGGNSWELRCSTLADELAARRAYSGLRPVTEIGNGGYPVWNGYASDAETAYYAISEADRTGVFVGGNRTTQALARFSDGWAGVFDVIDHDTTGQVGFAPQTNLVRREPGTAWWNTDTADSIEHIAVLNGAASYVLLAVLISRLGDGAMHVTYDVLPGLDRADAGGEAWRMGAGIDPDEIDVTGLRELVAGRRWAWALCREVTVEDLLRDFCLTFDLVWLVDNSGALTFRSIAVQSQGGSVVTIDDDVVVGEPVIGVDEMGVVSRITVKADYNPLADEFMSTVNAYDQQIDTRYADRQDNKTVESRYLSVADDRYRQVFRGTPAILYHERSNIRDIGHRLRRLFVADGRPRAYVDVTCTIDVLLTATLGSIVDVDLDVPDMQGNATTTGIARIVSRTYDLRGGTVQLRLQVEEKTRLVAPSCIVSSVGGGGGNVLTLSSDFCGGSDASDFFFVGCYVDVYDVSAQSIGDNREVTAVSGMTITLDAAPGFTVQAGVDFITWNSQEVNTGLGPNANGYDEDDYIYQMPDDEAQIEDAGFAHVTRWR